MTSEQIAYSIGYGVGFYGPIILGGIVLAGIIIGTYFFLQRCDRD